MFTATLTGVWCKIIISYIKYYTFKKNQRKKNYHSVYNSLTKELNRGTKYKEMKNYRVFTFFLRRAAEILDNFSFPWMFGPFEMNIFFFFCKLKASFTVVRLEVW